MDQYAGGESCGQNKRLVPGGQYSTYIKNVPGMYRSGMAAGLETMAKTCWYTVTLLKSSETLIVLLRSVDAVRSLSTSENHNIFWTGPKFSKLCEMWLFGILLLEIYQITYLSFQILVKILDRGWFESWPQKKQPWTGVTMTLQPIGKTEHFYYHP